jgi:Histidine kinase-, DNA gyrase B-, and HSP90-like ATPase
MPTMQSAQHTERRSFSMHPRLLYDVIRRQAGSLGKAVLEAVMNAADARATQVEITIEPDRVLIIDDGQGFRSREEIERFFEVFGQPHDASEQKTYGTFRMGRGQLFAHGRNRWRTGTFSMDVDIQRLGIDYEFQDRLPHEPGCRIEIDLYGDHHMLPSELDRCLAEVERYVRYFEIPVHLNGRVASVDPRTERWDVETEDYMIRFRASGPVDVYNLGAWVRDYPASTFGTGGVAVARRQLKVNFARNDVMADCPVWRRLRRDLDQRAKDQVARRGAKLTEEQRDYVIGQVRAGVKVANVEALPILGDARRVYWSLARLERHVRKHRITRITAASLYDGRGDRLIQLHDAVVLSTMTLARFRVDSIAELVAVLKARGLWTGALATVAPVPLGELAAGLSEKSVIVPEREWTPLERLVVEFLGRDAIISTLCPGRKARRVLKLGHSDVYAAWTDGSTYVAIDRRRVQDLTSLAGWYRLAHLLVHEYCHDDSTENTHVHSAEFFESYHNLAGERIGAFLEAVMREWPKALNHAGRKLQGRIRSMRDHLATLQRESERFAVEERAYEEVATQLALFDQPPIRRRSARAA